MLPSAAPSLTALRDVLLDTVPKPDRPRPLAEEAGEVLERRAHRVERAVLLELVVLDEELAEVAECQPLLMAHFVAALHGLSLLLQDSPRPLLIRLAG